MKRQFQIDDQDSDQEETTKQEDKKEEQLTKKLKPNPVSALPNDFHCKTTNVKKFCSMLKCLGTPGMLDTCFHFSEIGMTLYSRDSVAPIVIKAFWNKLFFQEYKCPTSFDVWLDPKCLIHLNKKINQIESIDIETLSTVNMEGLKIFGVKKSKSGEACKFFINLPQSSDSHDFLQTSKSYNWHIKTPSETFQENIGFASDTEPYINVTFNKGVLDFHAVGESGLFGAGISQSAEASEEITEHSFTNMFQQALIKRVCNCADLSKMLTLSYPLQQPDMASLCRFSYYLDQDQTPHSHFSIFMAEAITNES
jgi:hypothetical protein